MLLPHLFLTLPIEVYPATNVRKNFAITKFWQIFILSHPPPTLLLLKKIKSNVSKVLFFRTTDLYTVYLFSENVNN